MSVYLSRLDFKGLDFKDHMKESFKGRNGTFLNKVSAIMIVRFEVLPYRSAHSVVINIVDL